MRGSNAVRNVESCDVFGDARMKLEDLIAELSGADRRGAQRPRRGQEARGASLPARRRGRAALAQGAAAHEHHRRRRRGAQPCASALSLADDEFGDIDVSRLAYRQRDVDSRMPLDAELSLPEDLYSYRVRRWIAEFASEGSIGKAGKAFATTTDMRVPHRQVEELAARAAKDFEPF